MGEDDGCMKNRIFVSRILSINNAFNIINDDFNTKIKRKVYQIIALFLAIITVINSSLSNTVYGASFTYKWIGSASNTGSFSYGDETTDSAGWGYEISGVGTVFCINQGSRIYNNDNYNATSNAASFYSEGKSDMSYEAVVAKIAYYWINHQNSNFSRSPTQALLWQTMDK